MTLLVSLLALALYTLTSMALSIPFSQVKRSNHERGGIGSSFTVINAGGDDSGIGLTTVHDLIYMTNITVGGVDYPVQLDTGSSDLWIQNPTNPSDPLPNVNQTSNTWNLTYGIGWAYGDIAYASVKFAGISVPSQALLDVSSSVNPALSYGAAGLLGLGFTSLSTIDHVINGTGSSAGRSLLYNLFQDNPSEPNFIAFSLQRSSDPDGTADGTFSIGQYDPQYAAVANSNAISTWPVQFPNRWNVLLEAILVGDKTYTPTTTVPGAPSNRAVVLLDSGTSYTYVPTEICDAIYGNIPGAQYVSALGQWTVPCDAEVDMALQFDGQIFPLHPLDVTPTSLSQPSTCVGSFVPQSIAIGAGEFDWLVGDNFLRSVYSIYDFGDFDQSGKMGNPYIKLLALVDPNQASAEFHAIRGGTPRTNITYNTANSTTAPPASSTVTLSQDLTDTLNNIGKFFPAMMGIMFLNALILIILVIVGIVFLCKGRTKKPKSHRGRKSPMPTNRSSNTSLRQQPHAYEPVSMALTDDTVFTPPSPGFKKFSGVDRPKSSLHRMSVAPEDTPFTPPSPSSPLHAQDRPNSVALQPATLTSPVEDNPLMPPSPSYHSFDGGLQRPGSRPTSMVSQRQIGVAITDDAPVTSPTRELRSVDNNSVRSGSRPQSSASHLSQPIGVALTDGGPFGGNRRVSNASEHSSIQLDDRPRSGISKHVGVTLTDDPIFVPPRPFHQFEDRDFRPGDRPSSVAYPPNQLQQGMLAPPSPLFRSGGSADRPRSIA